MKKVALIEDRKVQQAERLEILLCCLPGVMFCAADSVTNDKFVVIVGAARETKLSNDVFREYVRQYGMNVIEAGAEVEIHVVRGSTRGSLQASGKGVLPPNKGSKTPVPPLQELDN